MAHAHAGWIHRATSAVIVGALALTSVAASSGQRSSPRTWTFDAGLDGWQDGGGAPELGFYSLGREYSTQELDPREGWVHATGGRHGTDPDGTGPDGTGAIAGRRMNGALHGSIESPFVLAPRGHEEAVVSLWYRWTGAGDDEVVIHVYGLRDAAPIRLDRATATPGEWHRAETVGAIRDEGPYGQPHVWVGVYSYFDEPAADCTTRAVEADACRVGFLIDDVTITWR